MMEKRKTLLEVTPTWMNNGIFSKLASWAPWASEWGATALDLVYYGNHSGHKKISPLVKNLLGTSETLSDEMLNQISAAARAMYGQAWAKLWATLNFEYDPISNYDMTETENRVTTGSGFHSKTGGESTTRTDNLSHTRTDNLSESNSGEVSEESSASGDIYGYNSLTGVPSDEQSGTRSGSSSNTRTNTGTQSDSNTGTQTNAGQTSESGSEQSEGTEDRTLTRKGNIGVTTSQQMIQSERELWMWHYFDTVFADLDFLLTLAVY